MKLASEIVDQAHVTAGHEEKAVVAVSSTGRGLLLGFDLDQTFRAGRCLALLLGSANPTPGEEWYLVAIRPDGRKRRFEKKAAERVLAASRMIDFPMGVAILTVKGRSPVCLFYTGKTESELLEAGLLP
jgi:hypothetical protein